MFNNNNDCIYKALSNTVLFEDKKINKNNPVQTTIRTRKNRIGFEKLHTAGLLQARQAKKRKQLPTVFLLALGTFTRPVS